MVQALDVYIALDRAPEALELMAALVQCGADPNPVEPASGIDVLTRAAHLTSLEVVRLVTAAGGKFQVLAASGCYCPKHIPNAAASHLPPGAPIRGSACACGFNRWAPRRWAPCRCGRRCLQDRASNYGSLPSSGVGCSGIS